MVVAHQMPKKDYREALQAVYEKASNQETLGWLRSLRQKAYQKFVELDFPTRRAEDWRYVNLGPVLKTPFETAGRNGQTLLPTVDAKELTPYFLSGAPRLVFLNGVYSQEFSSPGKMPRGVVLGNLASQWSREEERIKKVLGRSLESATNPFIAINTFSFRDGAYLYIPDHTVQPEPIHLLRVSVGGESPVAWYPRLVVILGDGAKADLVVDQIGFGAGRTFQNSVGEFALGKNAKLNFLALQRLPKETMQFLNAQFYLSQGATLEALAFSRGGSLIRNEFVVDFEETDGKTSLRGLTLLSDFSQVTNHILVNHKVPRCMSRQVFKNVLADKAQAEYTSLVHVWRDAQKSDTDQLDKNLLLSDGAHAYSRPQLKIDADDVKCTHGAATGQMAGDELFYLRSRGLDDKLARTVLTFGFAEEIIDAIPIPAVKRSLGDWLRRELSQMLHAAPL